MKSKWKIFWIVCSSFVVIGLALCIAGFSMGVTFSTVRAAFGDEIDFVENRSVVQRNYVDIEGDDIPYDGDVELHAEHSETEHLTEYQGIHDLSVDLDGGSLIIKTYDGDEVRTDFSGIGRDVNLSCEQEGGELDIDVEKKGNRIFRDSDSGQMIIYIPENYDMNEISLDVGAGEALIGDVTAYELSIDCGAGRVTYDTSLREADFNYSIECGIGEVQIGNSSYAGLGSERNINNQSSRTLDINCGVGEVIIKFI